MKKHCFLVLLLSFTSLQAYSADMWETNYFNKFVSDLAKGNNAAFISSCAVHSKSDEYLATIVYFPTKNKGIFAFSDRNHVVINSGDVSWTDDGQWNMGNLEGGTETVKILSDLFYKVTRLPFIWASPVNIKDALTAPPKNSCEMLNR